MSIIVGLVHTGDSIGSIAGCYFFQAYGWTSTGDDTMPDFEAMQTYYNGSIIARNLGISGSHLNAGNPTDLVSIAPAYIDSIIPAGYAVPPFDSVRKYIFATAIGSNDGALGGLGSTDLYAAAVASCCRDRKTAGYDRVLMATLLPRSDNVVSEPNRTAYNARLTDASWRGTHGIDGVIDLASEPTMGNRANCSNTTYYVDGIHPTFAGYTLLAPIYKAAIDAIIAGL